MKTIAFFFPYRIVSGVPVLFSNIAGYLSNRNDLKIYVVDYSNGYMTQSLKENHQVEVIEFRDGEHCLITTDYLVIQAVLPYAMRPELKISDSTKVLSWVLHVHNYLPIVFPFNFFRSIPENKTRLYMNLVAVFNRTLYTRLRRFVNILLENKALFFMDSSTLNTTNNILGQKNVPNSFLPITCSEGIPMKGLRINNEEILHLSWIGRLCDFKIHILNYTIKRIASYCLFSKRTIVFHIVGEGEMKSLLEPYTNRYFNVIVEGSIPKERLDAFLLNNIDINLSMGTSALESIKLAIPTIVLDFSFKKISLDYNYRWLHDTKYFDMGHQIGANDIQNKNNSIEHMLDTFREFRGELSSISYSYYLKYHSLSSVSGSLITALENISIEWGELDNSFFKRGLLRRIYEYKKYKLR